MKKIIVLFCALLSSALVPVQAAWYHRLRSPRTNARIAGGSGTAATLLALGALDSNREYRKLQREMALAKIDEGYAANDSDREIAQTRNRSLNRRMRKTFRTALALGIPAGIALAIAIGFGSHGGWRWYQEHEEQKRLRKVNS